MSLTQRLSESTKAIDAVVLDAAREAIKNDMEDEFYSGRVTEDRFRNITYVRHSDSYIELTGTARLSKAGAEALGADERSWSIKINHQPHPDYNRYGWWLVHFVTEFDTIHKGVRVTGRHPIMTYDILPGCEKEDLTRMLTGEFGHLTITPTEDLDGLYTVPIDEEYEHIFQAGDVA